MGRRIFKVTIYFLILLFSNSLYAQSDQGYIDVKGTAKVERRPLENAKVEIFENSLKIKQYSSNINGRFDFQLDLNKVYMVSVSKAGMVTKRIQFDTHVPENEIGIWTYKFTIEIFPMVEGLDISILENPIAKITFVEDWGEFDYDEAYTNSMLKGIDKLLKEYENLKLQAYDKTITLADQAFEDKEYEKAIELYDRAIDYNPYDEYPDDMIFKIDRILTKQYAKERQYEKAIAEADKNFTDENWDGAKSFYNRALSYLENPYPRQKLQEIETILSQLNASDDELKRIEEEFRLAMFEGDEFRKQKKYYEARDSYTKALNLKPSEPLPKENIAQLNILIAQLEKEEGDKELVQKSYNDAIALADQSYANKQYSDAKINYERALTFLPYESYPKEKLRELETILKQLEGLDADYNKLIASADNFLNLKEYTKSKANYQEALTLKPNEAYPKQKIDEINQIIAQEEGLENAYAQAISKGDQYYESKEYTSAKSEYENAINLKPTEEYPKQQLQKVNSLIAQLSAKDQNYQNAISQADEYFSTKEYSLATDFYESALKIKPGEAYPQQKLTEIEQLLASLKQNKKNYDKIIVNADKLFNSEQWENSKAQYEQALLIFPDELYPKNKIVEIENKLLALKSVEEQKVALEQNYTAAIQKGDEYFNANQYNESKVEFEKALALKPKEKYPKGKIDEIIKILQDSQAIEREYTRLITQADGEFGLKKYYEAKESYNKAWQLKANETYPQQKIGEIDQLLAQRDAERKKKEAIEIDYNNFIVSADNFYKQKDYNAAKENYQSALGLKPSEMYPKEKINEIDNILSGIQDIETRYAQQISNADIQFNNQNYEAAKLGYNNALSIKPKESYPQQKIDEINGILADLKQKEKQYDALISDADKSFDKSEWNEAKILYQQALTMLPNELYPKNKISEIDNKLLALKKAEDEQAAKDLAYNTAITNGDRLFTETDYVNARTEFEKAANIKPNEEYPKNKINEILAKLDEIKKNDQKYNIEIANADKAMASKNYDNALISYNNALKLKPKETYPQTKINEINAIKSDNKALEAKYDNLISVANNYFMAENYSGALSNFEEALSIKPNEVYPKNKINEINSILEEKKRAVEEMLANNAKYDKVIRDADNAYNLRNYENAINLYKNAQSILPNESYPGTQITKINDILAQQQIDLDNKYAAAIKEGDQLYGAMDYIKAKAAFEKALLYKPDEDYPKRKLAELIPKIEQQKNEEADRLALEKKYNETVALADADFKKGDFFSAKANYQLALTYNARAKYPEEQITKCDKLIQAQRAAALAKEEEERQKQLEASRSSFENNDFDFEGGTRSGAFLSDLAKKYPEGITEENFDKKNKKIKRIIVNRNGIAKEYIEVTYSYGTYYFRNGQNISRYIFASETKE